MSEAENESEFDHVYAYGQAKESMENSDGSPRCDYTILWSIAGALWLIASELERIREGRSYSTIRSKEDR